MKVSKKQYSLNKSSKVGDLLICPSCGDKFTKESYQQAFCKSKGGTVCKDYYWNNVTPEKKNNRTRISPASRSYYNNVILPNKAIELGFPDVSTMINHVDDFDGSWEAHYANVGLCEFCGLRPEYCECDEFDGSHLQD